MHANQMLWEITSASSFSGSGMKSLRPMLKRTLVPQRQPVAIAHVRDIDAIFYRTAGLHENYEALQRRIFDFLDAEMQLEPVEFQDANTNQYYLMRELMPSERFHRVLAVRAEWTADGRLTSTVELVDVGEECTLVEGLHELYRLPESLNLHNLSGQTIAGPCRLATDAGFERAAEQDPVKRLMSLTSLRSLLPVDGVFFAEIFQLPALPVGLYGTNVYGGLQDANDHWLLSQRVAREEGHFYQPGSVTSVNSIYQSMTVLKARSDFRASSCNLSGSGFQDGSAFNNSFRASNGAFNASLQSSSNGRGR